MVTLEVTQETIRTSSRVMLMELKKMKGKSLLSFMQLCI